MTRSFLIFILLFCTRLYGQNIASSSLHDKYLTFSDTGYIIYVQPHFSGLFVSTTDTSLNDALKKNSYLPYFRTYCDSFSSFILDNDKIPSFIREDDGIDIYRSNRLDQRSIAYFRAVITVNVSMMYYQYMKPETSQMKDFFLRDTRTNKDIYLREFIRSPSSMLDCVDVKVLE